MTDEASNVVPDAAAARERDGQTKASPPVKAAASLRTSEIRYRRLFESARDGILILDAASGKIEDVNPYLCELLGYAPENLVGKQLWEIGTFRDIAANQDAFRTLQEQEYIRYNDLPLETRDGQIASVEFVSNVYAENGHQVIQCNIRDIGERKQAMGAVQESQRFLKSTLDALSAHIAVLDEGGSIVAVNQAWQEFSEANGGTAVSCGVGVSYLGVCEEASGAWAQEAAALVQGIREVMAGRHHAFCLEYPCHSPSEERWFSVCVTRFVGEGPLHVVVAHENITARKQAENALRASEERFQSIVANVPGMVYQFVLQPDGSVEWPFVSEGCREIFQTEPETLKNNPLWPLDRIHPDDRSEFDRSVAASADTLSPWRWEGRHRLDSGKIIWIQGASRPHRLPGGGTRWDGLVMDITALKAAEEERDRFFTLSLDMLAIVGSDGYFKRLSPAFETTLGFSNAELMAVPFLEFVHPDDIAGTVKKMATLNGGTQLSHENRYRCRDGSYKSLQWMAAPYEALWYCVAHDVTKIRAAEAALQKANDELELHVMERTAELGVANEALRVENVEHQMTMGAFREVANNLQRANEELRSNEARLLQGNRLFTDLARLRASQMGDLDSALQQITQAHSTLLNAERCSVWLYNQDRSALRCLDLYEAATGTHSQGVELAAQDFPAYFHALESGLIIVADDARTHAATHELWEPYLKPPGIMSLLNAAIVVDGQIAGVLCCERTGAARPWKVDDQTFASSAAAICALALESFERTQAEAEMRQAREEADKANQAKSEFLSRMSHELRTPLNAILGFGQILDKQVLAPLQRESVGYILKGGRHLLDLINEVLDIARVEAGHLELSLEPIALDDVVPEACALVRPLAAERSIRLDEDLAQLGRSHILADRQRLKQVLINLISNAIKYNREGGQVEVSCEQKPGGGISIAIRDTGPGISPQDLPRLFTPFERLSASASEIEGTGLGLVLSQRLLTEMGGALSVQSTLGRGSTFTVELPQASAPAAQLANLPEGTRPVDASQEVGLRYSVLCIEDNPSNLRLIEAIFEMRPDITLLSAVQGSVGLDLARQHEPDLILLDLNLPDLNGQEVLIRLQQSAVTRDIPVVITSADATTNQIQRLIAAGARTYLTKPLDVARFLHTLDEFLPVTPALAAQPDSEEIV